MPRRPGFEKPGPSRAYGAATTTCRPRPRFMPAPIRLSALPLALFLLARLAGSALEAADYHVDPRSGDDAATGLAPASAWRSLDRANAVMLQPGDRLLFRRGGIWIGQLKPRGSGSPERPVRIGAYGSGDRPRIDGGGRHADAVLLANLSHVHLAGLAVTNTGPQAAPWRTGVRILAELTVARGLHLEDLEVLDVNGDLRKSHEGCGIFFETRGKGAHFDGLVIERCRVERCDRNGICQRAGNGTRSRGVIIRGNTLEDIGGDGIKLWGTNGGLIEGNTVRKARARCAPNEAAAGIWPFDSDDTLIQFNEVSGTRGTRDGQGYDADYGCRRTVFQYNYSHGNEGGFMLVCGPGRAVNKDVVIRYNLSVHDGIRGARVFHFGGSSQGVHVCHNTIVIGAHQDLPMLLFDAWNGGKPQGAVFTNNLFLVEPGGRASYRFEAGERPILEGNLFVGRHEGLPAGTPVTATPPRLTGPIAARPGKEALRAFRPLDRGFPRGAAIPQGGSRDLLGTPLQPGQGPAIGAIEPLP